jgi:hypothetical protein
MYWVTSVDEQKDFLFSVNENNNLYFDSVCFRFYMEASSSTVCIVNGCRQRSDLHAVG